MSRKNTCVFCGKSEENEVLFEFEGVFKQDINITYKSECGTISQKLPIELNALEGASIFVYEGKDAYIGTTAYIGDDILIGGEVKINYCPMCGRKLT